jgi:hypothetical protein
MKLSFHAGRRSQQRGIRFSDVDLILALGTPKRKVGGAVEYRMTTKQRQQAIVQIKRLLNALDKTAGKAVLVNPRREEIITVYNIT